MRVIRDLGGIYLTRGETFTWKKRLHRLARYAGIAVVSLSGIQIGQRKFWWFVPLGLVISVFLYRLFRMNPRRCRRCRAAYRIEGPFAKLAGLFLGWNVESTYWRGDPKSKDAPPEAAECHFPWRCRDCGDEYEVKDTTVKSFSHRPPIIRWW
ncbi:MAG: hypothetical protein G01um101472_596 [Parcubacteria group bacterium Gr01-1014_72]|nr:MAG: hypothetical protein G01um101472_596 [Parcubacteria group bacterium Gr01-1014_72]